MKNKNNWYVTLSYHCGILQWTVGLMDLCELDIESAVRGNAKIKIKYGTEIGKFKISGEWQQHNKMNECIIEWLKWKTSKLNKHKSCAAFLLL